MIKWQKFTASAFLFRMCDRMFCGGVCGIRATCPSIRRSGYLVAHGGALVDGEELRAHELVQELQHGAQAPLLHRDEIRVQGSLAIPANKGADDRQLLQ